MDSIFLSLTLSCALCCTWPKEGGEIKLAWRNLGAGFKLPGISLRRRLQSQAFLLFLFKSRTHRRSPLGKPSTALPQLLQDGLTPGLQVAVGLQALLQLARLFLARILRRHAQEHQHGSRRRVLPLHNSQAGRSPRDRAESQAPGAGHPGREGARTEVTGARRPPQVVQGDLHKIHRLRLRNEIE